MANKNGLSRKKKKPVHEILASSLSTLPPSVATDGIWVPKNAQVQTYDDDMHPTENSMWNEELLWDSPLASEY